LVCRCHNNRPVGSLFRSVSGNHGSLWTTPLFELRIRRLGVRVPPSALTRNTAGSLAFFRSSLFTVRVGMTDIGVEPSAVLDSILAATDRATDRDLGVKRSATLSRILTAGPAIDPQKAFVRLPPYCLALMQNLSPADQEALGTAIAKLATQAIPPDEKLDILILALINAVGPKSPRRPSLTCDREHPTSAPP